MALVHKLITGGEHWLPFALSKLRAMETRLEGKGVANANFSMPDGAQVAVRMENDQHFVRISGGPSYEFYTSEPVERETMATAGITLGVAGSALRVTALKPKPLFSSSLTPGPDDKWVTRPVVDEYGPSNPLLTWPAWQLQRFFEYTYWPGNGSKSIVTSTKAQGPGANSQCGWRSPRRSTLDGQYGNQDASLHDEGEDVVPAFINAKSASVGGPIVENNRIWGRHCAVQSAGGKKFFIHTDNYGRFQIYLVKDYEALTGTQRVPTNKYKLFTPPYPAWVTLPSINNVDVRWNQWLWAFNKDGTRAVSCPFHSEVADMQMIKTPSNSSTSIYGLQAKGNCVAPSDVHLVNTTLAPLIAGRNDTPGLVEFGIAIEVTGEGDMDFSVTFSLLRNTYFPDSGRFIYDAAYALKNRAKDNVYPDEDTLVTAEIECKAPVGKFVDSAIPPKDFQADPAICVHNSLDAVAYIVINANDDNLVKTELRRFVAQTNIASSFLTTAGFDAIVGHTFLGGEYRRNNPYGPDFSLGLVHGLAPTTDGFVIGVPTNESIPSQLVGTRSALAVMTTIMLSMELRNLSFHYYSQAYGGGTGGKEELLVYNESIQSTIYGLGDPSTVLDIPAQLAAATVTVPVGAVPVYQSIADTRAVFSSPGRGFNIHPAGHWSYAPAQDRYDDATLDIIHTRGGKRTTHKAMFNKAFNQTRDYTHYAPPTYVPGNVTADQLHGYLGGFRTFGIWITF